MHLPADVRKEPMWCTRSPMKFCHFDSGLPCVCRWWAWRLCGGHFAQHIPTNLPLPCLEMLYQKPVQRPSSTSPLGRLTLASPLPAVGGQGAAVVHMEPSTILADCLGISPACRWGTRCWRDMKAVYLRCRNCPPKPEGQLYSSHLASL